MNDRYEFEVIPICHGRENDYQFIFNNKNIIVYDVSDNKNYKELYSILVNKYDYLDVWLLKVIYYDESLSLDTIILYLDSNQNEVRINKTYNITDKILKIIVDDLIHYYDPVIPRDLNIKYL